MKNRGYRKLRAYRKQDRRKYFNIASAKGKPVERCRIENRSLKTAWGFRIWHAISDHAYELSVANPDKYVNYK